MDERLNQGNETAEQPSASPVEEQAEVPAAEPTLQEGSAEAVADASVVQADEGDRIASSEPSITEENLQQPYSYQNPYQPYGTPFVSCTEQKKSRNLPLIITAALAGCIMLGCCLIIAVGILRDGMADRDASDEQGSFGGQFITGQQTQSSGIERDENAVYNMPEIITEEKKGEELPLVEINKKVKNSVIGILVTYDEQKEPIFSGSGVIISEDGYILTNNHVIESAIKLTIVLSDGITEYQAAVVGRDERSDIAVLKIEANGLTAAELGNSDGLEVGETVVAIGNPYGMELAGTMTNGIVSALNRKIEMNGSFMTLIQTNASINPGNSGGPLVNAYGQVVGITSSKLVATGYEGIGFAIPINYVVDISEELITYGYIKTRAYIGIQGSSLTAAYAAYYDLPMGVYVYYVDPECSAAEQGLRKDDVIVGFAGKEVTSMAELNALKDAYKPGDKVKLTVWRDDKTFEIEVTLTESS